MTLGGSFRPLVGAVAWVIVVVASATGQLSLGIIELLFILAPLVVVPLCLVLSTQADLLGKRQLLGRVTVYAQACAALLGVASFCFPVGGTAAVLAGGWLLFCGVLGICGFRRMLAGSAGLDTACVAISLIYLPVGGAWFVASRWGIQPLGFGEPIVLLTAVHFHYAGFAAPLLAVTTGRALRDANSDLRTLYQPVLLGVLAGPALLAVGFVVGALVKLVATLVLVASQMGLSLLVVASLGTIRKRLPKVLLSLSAASAAFGMVLAGTWAFGEYSGQSFVNLWQMAQLHGVANAFGFVLCGLLGWLLLFSEGRGTP